MLNIHSMLERTAIINMKKSMVSLALAAAILASGTLANADALKDSAPIVNADTLSVHESFDHDEESGAWTLVTNRTQAALDALSNGYGCSSSGSTLFMYVTLKGNTLDNTVTPTLNVCSIGSTVINANAVSLLIDGVRYDFETETEVGAIGDYRAEIMSAPLNTDGIVMLGAMVESDKLMVLLHGSEKVNEYTIKTSSTSSERAQMQAASIDCVRDALDIYSALGTGANSERAINDWEDETGLTCAYMSQRRLPSSRVYRLRRTRVLTCSSRATALYRCAGGSFCALLPDTYMPTRHRAIPIGPVRLFCAHNTPWALSQPAARTRRL